MNDETRAKRETETPETTVTLLHWDRVAWVTPTNADAPREPTCLEWVIGTTLANAVAVANAPFCDSGGGKDALPELDLRKVIAIIAEQTHAGMLDDAILLLRDVLRHCIKRGDSSVFAVETAETDAEQETTTLYG